MKVCIVTLYRARNCGTFLQAYALGEKIKQLGHEVVYMRPTFKRRLRYLRLNLFSYLSAIKRRSMKVLLLSIHFNHRSRLDRHRFREVYRAKDADRFVLGSDTIWQLNRAPGSEYLNRFFGLAYPGDKTFSYAPSANGSSEEIFRNDSRLYHALKRMRDISVRDESTRRLVQSITGRQAQLVCDPVLLHDTEFYRSIQRPCRHRGFILLYTFGMSDFTDARIREIRSFARDHGAKLISFGVERKWCDLSLPYDSLAMPAYYEQADYVITNTFHGTVFSLLYGKQFVNLATRKAKVLDLLSYFGLSERTLAPEGSIVQILNRRIDQADLKKRIEDLRASSISYLQRNLT